MIKLVKLSLVVVIVLLLSSSVMAEEIQFRGVDFGSTIEEVEKKEGKTAVAGTEEMLFFEDLLLGKDVIVAYQFNQDNQFYNGAYLFQMQPSNPNTYIVTYDRVVGELQSKYGEPTEQNENWIPNPTFNDDLGWAVKTGELSLNTKWKFDNGEIQLVLGNNDGMVFAIFYESTEYTQQEQQSSKL